MKLGGIGVEEDVAELRVVEFTEEAREPTHFLGEGVILLQRLLRRRRRRRRHFGCNWGIWRERVAVGGDLAGCSRRARLHSDNSRHKFQCGPAKRNSRPSKASCFSPSSLPGLPKHENRTRATFSLSGRRLISLFPLKKRFPLYRILPPLH